MLPPIRARIGYCSKITQKSIRKTTCFASSLTFMQHFDDSIAMSQNAAASSLTRSLFDDEFNTDVLLSNRDTDFTDVQRSPEADFNDAVVRNPR